MQEPHDPGRQLAAETAEAVFTAQSSIEAGRAFYADVKGRAEKAGRSRDDLKILPGCFVVIGETVEQAREKRAKLDSLVHFANAIGSLSIALGHDASKFDPDGPLPEIPWPEVYVQDAVELMGEDFWRYGVRENARDIETLARYSFEQGLATRQLAAEEIFHPSVLEISKV